MISNPMSDMPWNIYLDYLADQGFDELRHVDVFSLICGNELDGDCHNPHGIGIGDTNFYVVTGCGEFMITTSAYMSQYDILYGGGSVNTFNNSFGDSNYTRGIIKGCGT